MTQGLQTGRPLVWVVLALAMAGAIALAAHYGLTNTGGFAGWPLASVFTAERLLPLLGLGLLLGQLPRRVSAFEGPLLIMGGIAGVFFRHQIYDLLAAVPGAAGNAFLMGPIALVLIGLALVWPPRIRPWIALPLAMPLGSAIAIATLLGDQTLHQRSYRLSAFVTEIWSVLLIAILIAAIRREWLAIGSRIVASWLIAIGLLYGGAHIASKQKPLQPPPFAALPPGDPLEGFAHVLPALDGLARGEGTQ